MFAAEYKTIGTYLLEYSIFKIDVYQISYLKNEVSEKLVLDYKIDVKREYSQEGWRVGLEHELSKVNVSEKAQWLLDNTIDLKSGDVFSIKRTNNLIELFRNDQLIAKTEDSVIAKLAFEPWLGEKPVSDELKKSLLKNL